jgi:outer membrane protein assembly factor BamB
MNRARVPNRWWCFALAPLVLGVPATAQPVGPFPSPPPTTRHGKAPYDRFFPLRLAWASPLPAAVAARPTFDDHHLYVALRTGRVTAYSRDTGQASWTVETAPATSVHATHGLVLVVGADVVEARTAPDGEVRWRRPLASPPAAPGEVVGERLVLGLESGAVAAFDAATGAPIWQRALGSRLNTAPAGDGPLLLLGLADGRLVALDQASGEPVWSFTAGGPITGVALDDARVFAGSLDNHLYSLSARDGRLDWKWRTGADVVGAPALDSQKVYFASLDNLLRALDKGNGSQQWKRALRARPIGGPTVVGEAVMVAGFAAEIRTHWVKDGRAVDRVATDGEISAPLVLLPRAWPRVGGLAVVTEAGQLAVLVERIDPEIQAFKGAVGDELTLTGPPDLP